MDDEENKQFAAFERSQEFFNALEFILSCDLTVDPTDEEEDKEKLVFQKLCLILDEYQEQSYLLDPFLERMVVPAVNALRTHAARVVREPGTHVSVTRIGRLAGILYWYMKTRGYKTILRFFPHQVSDLSIALDYLASLDSTSVWLWALRYMVLLWLSLVTMIPFDLAFFDQKDAKITSAEKLEIQAKAYLDGSGADRAGAAILLARLYRRKDTAGRLPIFLAWAGDNLKGSSFSTLGILQTLCEIAKSAGMEDLAQYVPQFQEIARVVLEDSSKLANTLIRKWCTKLISRIALISLPSRRSNLRKGRVLLSSDDQLEVVNPATQSDDVPEAVDTAIEQLFQVLQDKDTTVRWSAAKGLARVAERLPKDFAVQVLDSVLALFSVHSPPSITQWDDLPVVAESIWHGTCLACAEFARRGLVLDDRLPDLIAWLLKGLYFDIKRGTYSIGSSVRDATCYVLWSLARAQDSAAMKTYALDLAQNLMAVALFDREVHIRRAASAAFQEHVGRMGLFPHGIDVLPKTDFYAVSNRRNAFITAAPQVAIHPEYRGFLINHLLNVTLQHWDPTVRTLGAQSLAKICELDLINLGPEAVARCPSRLSSVDSIDIHGGLIALSELALTYQQHGSAFEAHRLDIFRLLDRLSDSIFKKYKNDLILEAACFVIANAVSAEALVSSPPNPSWVRVTENSFKHINTSVQEAGAAAMAAFDMICLSRRFFTYVNALPTATASIQQSTTRFLGGLCYASYPRSLSMALHALLDSVDPTSGKFIANVESRRNCYSSMSQILLGLRHNLSKFLQVEDVQNVIRSLVNGLKDYSIDERGDVGSWIRIACIQSLGNIYDLASNASANPEAWFPASLLDEGFAGILKQGVERLDNVRHEAGVCVVKVLERSRVAPIPFWKIDGLSLLLKLFIQTETDDESAWGEGSWIFPKAVQLLQISRYRLHILSGIILSIGSKNESTQGPATKSLVEYCNSIPVIGSEQGETDLSQITQDIVKLAKENFTRNNLFIPVLQASYALVEGGAIERLVPHGNGTVLREILDLAGKNADRLKNVQRILASMKVVIAFLAIPSLSGNAIEYLPYFLNHAFPKVRSTTAEELYVLIQTKDILPDEDPADDLLLETEWSSTTVDGYKETAQQVIAALKRGQ